MIVGPVAGCRVRCLPLAMVLVWRCVQRVEVVYTDGACMVNVETMTTYAIHNTAPIINNDNNNNNNNNNNN